MLRTLAPLLPLATLLACAPAPRVLSRAPEPVAEVTTMRVAGFDRQRAQLELELAIENPGATLALDGADFEVLVEGRTFAWGTTTLRGSLANGAASNLKLPIELAFLDLPVRARRRLEQGEPIAVVARGRLRAHDGPRARAIEFAGETEVVLADDGAAPP